MIERLRNYKRGKSKTGYFSDLPPDQREAAWTKLQSRLEARRAGGLPTDGRRLGCIVAGIKSVALHPRTREWGKRMIALRGNKAAWRKLRAEGRNPLKEYNEKRAYWKSVEDPEQRTKPAVPPEKVTSRYVRGTVPGRTSKEVGQNIAAQVEYRLSSDDLFSINTWPRLSKCTFELVMTFHA